MDKITHHTQHTIASAGHVRRQASQRRNKGSTGAHVTANAHHQMHEAAPSSSRPSAGGGSGNMFATTATKPSTLSPNLHLYSNYLMSQNSNVTHFSPTTQITSNSAKMAHGNPNLQQGLLQATSSAGSGPQNLSMRVKKFKQQRQPASHMVEHSNEPVMFHTMQQNNNNTSMTWREKLEQSYQPNALISKHPNPSTAGGKARPQKSEQQQQFISRPAQQQQQLGMATGGGNFERSSLMLHQMTTVPQRLVKAKSGGGAASTGAGVKALHGKGSANNYGSVLSINQLQNLKPPASVAHSSPGATGAQSHATSPDHSVLQMKNMPTGSKKQKASENIKFQENVVLDDENGPANSPVDQIYLKGSGLGQSTGDQTKMSLTNSGGVATMHQQQTKTIFDYSSGASQASQGNFVFQPVIKSPQGQAPTQVFKSSTNSSSKVKQEPRPVMKPPSSMNKESSAKNSGLKGASGPTCATAQPGKRSRSRKKSSNSSGPTQRELEQQNPANFYKQFVSRNANLTARGVTNSRESLKANKNLLQETSQGSSGTRLQKNDGGVESGVFHQQQQQQPSPNESHITEVNKSAINNYMQTFQQQNHQVIQVLPDGTHAALGEGLITKKQLVKSPTNISRTDDSRRAHHENAANQRVNNEPLSVMGTGQRNIQTANGGARTSFRTNMALAQKQANNQRPKFITRHNQLMSNANVSSSMNTTAQGTRKLSKNESRSPSMKPQTIKSGSGRPKKDSIIGGHVTNSDLNLTAVQAEEVNQAPRDSYTAFTTNPGVFTPEPVFQSSNPIVVGRQGTHYRSPDHRNQQQQQQQQMMQDQHQTYFTSDSHERLQGVQQSNRRTQHNGSFAMQGSPRASYYSPQRNQSSSKNLWLNDTIPAAISPQRQTLTPSNAVTGGGASSGKSSNNKTDKKINKQQQQQQQKKGGVPTLGSSYDFNKLKKGLDQVRTKNTPGTKQSSSNRQSSSKDLNASSKKDLNLYQKGSDPQHHALQPHTEGASASDAKPKDSDRKDTEQASNKVSAKSKKIKKVTTKDLANFIEQEEQEKKKQEEREAQENQEDANAKKAEEEVIVYSDNHSMDDYMIGSEIGHGAYATVHIGMYRRYNKKVALKIYQKDKMKDLSRKKSVRREIKLMRRLDHPNIARLYDAVETDTQVILVMEFVGGGSTHGFLKSKPNRQMDEAEARKIFSQLMSALNYLHTKSIAHRDIKLENVMLDRQGNVKLIDFGFSTQIPNTQKIKLFCGTPSYMAPEIVKKIEFCGPPADIYATGVLLFAFFCGCFPYRGKDDKDLYKKIANDDLVIPDHVPLNPRKLIALMLQKNPENRPTANILFNEGWVQAGLSNTLGSPRTAAQQTRSNSNRRRNEMNKPFSPGHTFGALSPDHRGQMQQHHPQFFNNIIYDPRAQAMTQVMPRGQGFRVVVGSDSSARSNKTTYTNKTMTGGRSSVRSPRDAQNPNHVSSNVQPFTRNANHIQQVFSDGERSSTRGFSNQREPKRRGGEQANLHGMNFQVAPDGQPNQARLLTRQDELQSTEAMFTVTKPAATNQLLYGHPAKPSTPLNIGRYYAAPAQRQKLNKQLRVNTNRAAHHAHSNKGQEERDSAGPQSSKAANTVRNNQQRNGLVVDNSELALQSNTSRGEISQRRGIAGHQAQGPPPSGQNYQTAGAPLSPSNERFPGRKQSGTGNLFNSEAYKAYYTHSAAAGNNPAANMGIPPNFVTVTEQQVTGQPLLGIAQEGPLLAGPNGATNRSPKDGNAVPGQGHQTINNNINIINYITQIACPHPSHRAENASGSAHNCHQAHHHHQQQQHRQPSSDQAPQQKSSSQGNATKTNNWTGSMHSETEQPSGVYSPTGKSMPGAYQKPGVSAMLAKPSPQ